MVRGAAGRVEGVAATSPRGGRHICIVTETYPPEINGVALTLSRLVRGLRARGHEVSVVRPRQATDGRAHGRGNDMLVPGLAVPGMTDLRVGLPAGRALRHRWAADRPDVVYVATEGPLGWSAVRAGDRLGLPLWSGFHTNFHRYARHYGAGWLSAATLSYLRRFHNRTRGTLVATEDLRASLGAAGFGNVAVLGRGVDGALFTPARRSRALRQSWGASDDHLVALHVGRVAREKSIPLAVEAYRAMQRTRPLMRFVAVGDGPLRTALQTAHPDLLFCGARTGEALAEHYASADVFLFPSESETFGNVTLEAMACGLAVVAYDYAAARVHIAPGETGVLVPCGHPEAFVAAAAELASGPEGRCAMGRRAREHAASLDWREIARQFAHLVGAEREAVTASPTPTGSRSRSSRRRTTQWGRSWSRAAGAGAERARARALRPSAPGCSAPER